MKSSKKVFIVLLVIEIGFLFGWSLRIRWDIRKLDGEVGKIRDEIQQIETKNKTLADMEIKLNDLFFREKLARERLGLARTGEVLYHIIPREKLPSSE